MATDFNSLHTEEADTARRRRRPRWWLPVGIVLAAVLALAVSAWVYANDYRPLTPAAYLGPTARSLGELEAGPDGSVQMTGPVGSHVQLMFGIVRCPGGSG